MTTTADKASGNGATTTTRQVPAQREHGLNRLREDQTYHLSALIVACLSEAEHLVRKVNSKAFSRTIDHDGTKVKAAEALGMSRATIYRKIHEYGIIPPARTT